MNINVEKELCKDGVSEIITTHKRKYRSYGMPNYIRVGLTENGDTYTDLLLRCSKGAFGLFAEVMKIRNTENNMVTLREPGSKSMQVTRSNSLRELEGIGLIRKVGVRSLKTPEGYIVGVPKRTYIINPCLLLPRTNDGFAEALAYWKQLDEVRT